MPTLKEINDATKALAECRERKSQAKRAVDAFAEGRLKDNCDRAFGFHVTTKDGNTTEYITLHPSPSDIHIVAQMRLAELTGKVQGLEKKLAEWGVEEESTT